MRGDIRYRGGVVLTGCALAVTACGGSSTGPADNTPLAFAYVADAGAFAQLFIFRNDSAIPLSTGVGNDTDPNSAAGLLVFSSDRDGNDEIYVADEAGVTQHRVTNSPSSDVQPALSPTGDRIAFSGSASGIPRIYVVPAPTLTDTGYPPPTAVQTGADSFVPEQSPAWSPDGTQLAFASTRTGTSQVWIVPAAGGAAQQITRETGGAFNPAWSADGQSIIYESASGSESIARVNVTSGALTTLATDSLGVSQPSCNATLCLAVTDLSGGGGAIVSFSATSSSSSSTKVVLPRTNNERQPAILVAAH